MDKETGVVVMGDTQRANQESSTHSVLEAWIHEGFECHKLHKSMSSQYPFPQSPYLSSLLQIQSILTTVQRPWPRRKQSSQASIHHQLQAEKLSRCGKQREERCPEDCLIRSFPSTTHWGWCHQWWHWECSTKLKEKKGRPFWVAQHAQKKDFADSL